MTPFIKGLILGIGLSCVGAVTYFQFFEFSDKQTPVNDVIPSSKARSEPVLANNKLRINIEHVPSNSRKRNNKATLNQKEEPNILETDSKLMENERNRINDILDALDPKELVRVEAMLKNLNAKKPMELFELEAVDPVWSLKKQAEFEYSFYGESPLKDLGSLESIVCKTSLCRAVVRIPVDSRLRPSSYMDWGNPSSVSILNDPSDGQYRLIELILRDK